jgi:hypothetical protein
LFYSFIIGFVGAILFLLVDKYEPEGPLARLLNSPGVRELAELRLPASSTRSAPRRARTELSASAETKYP